MQRPSISFFLVIDPKEEKMQEDLIRDERPGMSLEEKNAQLSVALVSSPTCYYNIIEIKRSDAPESGWLIRHT